MQHFYLLYKTTNLINGKEYIGIHQTNNLDDGYLGSGLAMKRAIRKYGKENFKREILEYCNSVEELIQKEKEYVNESWINAEDNYNLKTGGNNYGILSEESKAKISATLKEGYSTGRIITQRINYGPLSNHHKSKISTSLLERYERIEHHLKGKIPWNKGKEGVQVAWNKGIESGPMSEEQKANISETLKERYKNQVHHLKGKTGWSKGKKLPPTWNKGVKMEQIECPHCKKMVDKGNGKRWHFDNCKLR